MFKMIRKYIKNRYLISSLILLIGIVGSILISNTSTNNTLVKNNNQNNDDSTLSYSSENPYVINTKTNNNNKNTDNLTNFITDQYIKKIIEKNPEGPQEINGEKVVNIPTTGSFDLSDINIESKTEEVFGDISFFTKKDINITQNNTSQNQLDYITKLNESTIENFSNISFSEEEMLENWINSKDSKQLTEYKTVLSKQIDNLLEMTVPSNWSQFHIETLNLFQEKIVMYDALINHEEDPMKSIVALGRSIELIEETISLVEIAQNQANNF